MSSELSRAIDCVAKSRKAYCRYITAPFQEANALFTDDNIGNLLVVGLMADGTLTGYMLAHDEDIDAFLASHNICLVDEQAIIKE